MKRTFVPFADAAQRIRDADLLLWRRGGPWYRRWYQWLIAQVGRSPYCHAAMAAWWSLPSNVELGALKLGVLTAVEMQAKGGRAVNLKHLVDQAPGRIDVYASNPNNLPFEPLRAVAYMLELTGRRYGWWTIARIALRRLPLLRLIIGPELDDRANGSQPVCSPAFAAACRAGGQDVVPRLPDRLTEPGDLARSTFFRYMFSLVP